MCYSALIRANLRFLSEEFGLAIAYEDYLALLTMRLDAPELKLPFGIDRYLVLSRHPEEQRLAPLVRRFHEEEKMRIREEIRRTQEELRALGSGKPGAAARKKIEARERRLGKLHGRLETSFERISGLDERIFPGSFAPVIVLRGGRGRLSLARYRVRRTDGGEIPYQYNVFNARSDSLRKAATWKGLFGRSHAIFPFVKFFEWVERDGAKLELAFSPQDRSGMWAASLLSEPRAGTAAPFASFAMVTDDPPPEVLAAGHDRCPVFLRRDAWERWLEPGQQSPEQLLELLAKKEKVFYINALTA